MIVAGGCGALNLFSPMGGGAALRRECFANMKYCMRMNMFLEIFRSLKMQVDLERNSMT
jgi:hypothetical protein